MRVTRGITAGIAVMATAVLAGCGGGGGSSAGGGGGAADSTLDVVLPSGITTIDPAFACNQNDYAIVKNAYDTLVRYGPVGPEGGMSEIEPGLAESWDVSDDKTTYTFHLREDVTFPSGNPLTADDVVKSIERIRKKEGCQDYVLTLGDPESIKAVEKVDDHTVRFRIARPDPLFLGLLAQTGNGPVDWKLLEEHGGMSKEGDDWLARNTAGAGAYQVTSYEPDSQIVMEANEAYWDGEPASDRVVVRIAPDTTTLETLVRSGEADMAYGVPLKDVDSLADQGKQLIEYPSQFFIYLGFNNKMKPLDDPRVRHALSLVVPRQEIADRFGYGHVSLFDGPLPPAMPHSPKLEPPAPNVEEAKRLLAEAGVADGFPLSIAVKNGEAVQADIATVIQAAFEEIGVDVKIQTLGPSAFTDQVFNFKAQSWLISDGAPLSDPAYFLGFYLKCDNVFNQAQYCSEKVDELLAEGRFDFDPENRDRIYAEISDEVIADAPYVSIFAPNTVIVAAASLTGYENYPDQQPVFRTIAVGG